MDELGRMDVQTFKNAEKIPVVLVLDNIRSLHNVGSIFRTADAFRVQEVILCGITGTPPNKEMEKTALGATSSVQWTYAAETKQAVEELKSKNYKVFALEQTDVSISLETMEYDKNNKFCFVFGNEVFGVSEDVIHICDGSLEIPQFGTKHSFNVSVSTGILLWDYFLKNHR